MDVSLLLSLILIAVSIVSYGIGYRRGLDDGMELIHVWTRYLRTKGHSDNQIASNLGISVKEFRTMCLLETEF
jgi:hypothetical protein